MAISVEQYLRDIQACSGEPLPFTDLQEYGAALFRELAALPDDRLKSLPLEVVAIDPARKSLTLVNVSDIKV